ncbi:putative ribonuclease H-like domain-containing protein [Tanacetum coccineum]|uniref:Ribonuclease H-like domain-containing protein n=1 Tax=Tanacetum coccineum TaxID=301880 RepID=A0ABQ4YN87_9ASTR
MVVRSQRKIIEYPLARDRAVVRENKGKGANAGNPQQKEYKEKGVIDNGCSKHMTRNKCYLDEYEDYDGGFVSFGDGKGRISGKGKIKTGSLDFHDVVLIINPHNKTPYELIRGRPPLIDFMKPFRCPVTILNTKDHQGKFDGKDDEGFFIGYYVVNKAIRAFNKRTRIVEETLNIIFLKNTPNVKGNGPAWLFDVDSLSISMNYVPVATGNKTNGIAGTKDNIVAGPKDSEGDAGMKPTEVDENEVSDKSGKHDQEARSASERLNQREMQTKHTNSTNGINTVSTLVSTAGPSFDTAVPSTPVNAVGPSISTANESEEQLFERFSPFKNAFTLPPVPNISSMDNTGIFGNAYDDEDVEEEVDMKNIISSYLVPDTSFTKFHKDHPEDQVTGSLKTPIQIRHMTKITEEHGLFSLVHKVRRTNHKDFQNRLFACFLSQMEPKKPVQALKDPSWVEAMQNELL